MNSLTPSKIEVADPLSKSPADSSFGFGELLAKAAAAADSPPPAPPPPAPAPAADPLEMVRKIFVGQQLDDVKKLLDDVRAEIAKLGERLEVKISALEKRVKQIEDDPAHGELKKEIESVNFGLREELAHVTQAAADALQAQSASLATELEQTRAHLVTSVDDRFRKLSAASVPRTHLAEILRDLSARLHPSNP
jgi:DNA repair exonuclease SbcCD ATPase subunit